MYKLTNRKKGFLFLFINFFNLTAIWIGLSSNATTTNPILLLNLNKLARASHNNTIQFKNDLVGHIMWPAPVQGGTNTAYHQNVINQDAIHHSDLRSNRGGMERPPQRIQKNTPFILLAATIGERYIINIWMVVWAKHLAPPRLKKGVSRWRGLLCPSLCRWYAV